MRAAAASQQQDRWTRSGLAAPDGAFRALVEIGTQIQAEEENLDSVLRLIVNKACQLVGTDVGWLALVNEESGRVEMAVTSGIRTPDFSRMAVEVGEGLGGLAIARQRTLVVHDYAEYSHATPSFVRDTVLEEGVVSVVCAPMMRSSRMVGALYVGNRRRTEFSSSTADLMSALAAQASVAIVNARLLRRLRRQNDLLEHSFAIHRELTAAGLAGAGMAEVGAALARLMGRPVDVEQRLVAPFVVRHDPDGSSQVFDDGVDRAEATGTSLPLVAGGDDLGRITAVGDEPLTELQRRALEHGGTVLTLELVKHRAAQEVESRLRAELLEELLEAAPPVGDALSQRAARFGVEASAPHRTIVVEAAAGDAPPEGGLIGLARAAIGHARLGRDAYVLSARRGERAVLALRDPDGSRSRAVAEAVTATAGDAGLTAWAGVSRMTPDFPAALREALACVHFARASGREGAIVNYGDLGSLRFLLDAEDLGHAAAVVEERLQPLIDYDRAHRVPLLPTLRAFVEADGHQPTAAGACFIHVSTLKYRMARVREILGVQPSQPDVKFELRLAFRLIDLLESRGVSGGAAAPPPVLPSSR